MSHNNPPANVIHPPHMPIRRLVLALVGIVLVAVNLRLAITSGSVLYVAVGKDVTGFSATIIGILPLICFSIFGLLAHNVAEKVGFERPLLTWERSFEHFPRKSGLSRPAPWSPAPGWRSETCC